MVRSVDTRDFVDKQISEQRLYKWICESISR